MAMLYGMIICVWIVFFIKMTLPFPNLFQEETHHWQASQDNCGFRKHKSLYPSRRPLLLTKVRGHVQLEKEKGYSIGCDENSANLWLKPQARVERVAQFLGHKNSRCARMISSRIYCFSLHSSFPVSRSGDLNKEVTLELTPIPACKAF